MRREDLNKSVYSLRGDNRGASLIAVIVALVFVVTMGMIITETTTTNILMRGVEQSGKENFYSAEAVMDDLKRALGDVAAEALQEAYMGMLSLSGTAADDAGAESADPQEKFCKLYIDSLKRKFGFDDDTSNKSTDGKFVQGEYKLQSVKDAALGVMADGAEKTRLDISFEVGPDTETCTIDYKDGKKALFTLRNLTIKFTDEDLGYETWISTDMVFSTPTYEYDGEISQSFMSYALITDDSIAVEGTGILVEGSVYAGSEEEGIKAISGTDKSATFVGDNIVTMGDIVVRDSARLTFGEEGKGTTHVWARNISTKGGSDTIGPRLEMNGEINVADDLELNGTNSVVILNGSYNGYNFSNGSPTKSSDSSAILINGVGCTLDLKGLDHLFLAGRAFITRTGPADVVGSNGDIMFGESLSVRTDQIAYYVNDKYVEVEKKNVDGKEVDVYAIKDDYWFAVLPAEYAEALAKQAQYESDPATGEQDAVKNWLNGVNGWLVTNNAVTPYYYRENTSQYFLNFKDEKSANDFFRAYWDNRAKEGSRFIEYGEDYGTAIMVDKDTVLTLSGEMLYRNNYTKTSDDGMTLSGSGDGGLKLRPVKPNLGEDSEDWDGSWGGNSIYSQRSAMLDSTYRSLLSDLGSDSNVIGGTLFRRLINEGKLKAMIADDGLKTDGFAEKAKDTSDIEYNGIEISMASGEIVLLELESDKVFSIPDNFKGIVIVTDGDNGVGTVKISGSFTGMVISKGMIQLAGSAQVTADADLVKRIFEEVKTKEYSDEFADIFNGYKPSYATVTRIGEYLYYENWTKNEE